MSRQKNLYSLKSKISTATFGLLFLCGLLSPLLLFAEPALAAACTTPSPSYGTDSLSINVPSATTYVIWTRLLSPASTSNEILLQVDTSNCYTVGGSSSIKASTWTWVNYENGNTGSVISLSLSAGTHTFKYLGNEPGVGVDRVELISGNSCTPSGTGDNCNVSSSSSSSSSGSSSSSSSSGSGSSSSSSSSGSGSSSSGSGITIKPVTGHTSVISSSGPVTVPVVQGSTIQSGSVPLTLLPTTTTASSTDSISKVQYSINNKLVHTSTTAPFSYKINTGNLNNGTYKLTTTTYYASGKVITQTANLVVKHTFWRQVWLTSKYYLIALLIIIILGIGYIFWRRRSSDLGGSNIDGGINPEIHVSAPPQIIAPQT